MAYGVIFGGRGRGGTVMVLVLAAVAAAGAARAQGVTALALRASAPAASPSLAAGGGIVINMTSMDAVSSNLSNSTTVLSNGGLFAGALSNVGQGAQNTLNVYGTPGIGTALVMPLTAPIGGLGQTVTLNMMANAGGISQTINNTNVATSLASTLLPGGLVLGGAVAPSGAAGNQGGSNQVNSAGLMLPSGTVINLSQMAAGTLTGGSMSVVNTLGALGLAGPASVGTATGTSTTTQSAGNLVNGVTVAGAAAINVAQISAALAPMQIQAVNRALSFAP